MRFVAPWLYAVSSAVLASIALAFVFGGLTPAIAGASLGIGAIAGAIGFWDARASRWEWPRYGAWEWSAILVFTLFSLRAFLWLVFFIGDEIEVLSPNNLGDLSLHITYIREMASGEPFWPENPIIAGTKLTYPVGVDLLHSLLVLCGADIFRAFAWLGLAGSILSGVMLLRWGGAFTLAGFLCNGGMAGLALFLATDERGQLAFRLADYQSELAWKSIPLALFVTQRGFLFAIPAGLLLLCSWRARFFFSPGKDSPTNGAQMLPWWGELLLYASMPVFHFHTFLFLSILLAAWYVMLPPARRPLELFISAALVPATLLVLFITNWFHGPSVLGWKVGWMQDAPEHLAFCRKYLETDSRWITRPVFWLVNFGILPFLTGYVLYLVARDRRNIRDRAWLYPALGVFLLCCLVKFAPWEWDNTKLMVWSYLILLPILWQQLVRQWPVSVQVIACAMLFGSGFVCLVGDVISGRTGSSIAQRSELDFMARDLGGISYRERFLAKPNYNHPLLLLGRKVALGYMGHVWSHGYEWESSFPKMDQIMNGEPGWRELAEEFHSHYLFWGRQEKVTYPQSAEPWKTEAQLVASGPWGEVYDLLKPPID